MTERVGLVFSGAAARGRYQAGALSVLLPALAAEGHSPVLPLGTSSDGITAALVARYADLPPAAAGPAVEQTWLDFGDVFRNPAAHPRPDRCRTREAGRCRVRPGHRRTRRRPRFAAPQEPADRVP